MDYCVEILRRPNLFNTVYYWCKDNNINRDDWKFVKLGEAKVKVLFENSEDAVMFKLKFGV